TGMTVKKHKDLKGLKTQNLRDHMSEAELIFTALAELSTRQIAEAEKAGKKGGAVAKIARKELESRTGQKVMIRKLFTTTSRTEKAKQKEITALTSFFHFHSLRKC